MNRIILLLMAMVIGLSAQADYTVTTQQPLYSPQIYQPVGYSTAQSYSQPYSQQYSQSYIDPYTQQYAQQYNQQYNQADNQAYYQNPYQTQCQSQYVNPYRYRNAYGNNLPYTVVNSALSGLGTTSGTGVVVKSLGRSMLSSLLRGY